MPSHRLRCCVRRPCAGVRVSAGNPRRGGFFQIALASAHAHRAQPRRMKDCRVSTTAGASELSLTFKIALNTVSRN